MDVSKFIKNNKLSIIVKPNSKKTEILGYDEDKKALRVAIAAKTEDNEANLEVIRFFKRLLKRDVRIKIGLKNKNKVLEILS